MKLFFYRFEREDTILRLNLFFTLFKQMIGQDPRIQTLISYRSRF